MSRYDFADVVELRQIRDDLKELADRAEVIRMPALTFLFRAIGTAAAAGSLNRLKDHVADWVQGECAAMEDGQRL